MRSREPAAIVPGQHRQIQRHLQRGRRGITAPAINSMALEQKSLLYQLGLTFPERLKALTKCSADFSAA